MAGVPLLLPYRLCATLAMAPCYAFVNSTNDRSRDRGKVLQPETAPVNIVGLIVHSTSLIPIVLSPFNDMVEEGRSNTALSYARLNKGTTYTAGARIAD